MALAETKVHFDDYVKGKTWFWYVPGWLFGLYWFFKLLDYDPNMPLPWVVAIPQSFDFMLHELAHIVTAFLPALVTASAGSFSELLLGGLLVWGAFKTRCYFASMFCALWFMLACQSSGTYMADARAQKLALVSLGGMLSGTDKTIHDWNFVFGKLHILGFDTFIGGTVRVVGGVVGFAGLVFAAWLIYAMATATGKPALSASENSLLTETKLKADASKQATIQKHPATPAYPGDDLMQTYGTYDKKTDQKDVSGQ